MSLVTVTVTAKLFLITRIVEATSRGAGQPRRRDVGVG